MKSCSPTTFLHRQRREILPETGILVKMPMRECTRLRDTNPHQLPPVQGWRLKCTFHAPSHRLGGRAAIIPASMPVLALKPPDGDRRRREGKAGERHSKCEEKQKTRRFLEPNMADEMVRIISGTSSRTKNGMWSWQSRA